MPLPSATTGIQRSRCRSSRRTTATHTATHLGSAPPGSGATPHPQTHHTLAPGRVAQRTERRIRNERTRRMLAQGRAVQCPDSLLCETRTAYMMAGRRARSSVLRACATCVACDTHYRQQLVVSTRGCWMVKTCTGLEAQCQVCFCVCRSQGFLVCVRLSTLLNLQHFSRGCVAVGSTGFVNPR